MSPTETKSSFSESLEKIRETLRTKRLCVLEYFPVEAEPIFRELIVQLPHIANPGLVNVQITGGEKSLDDVSAKINIVGLDREINRYRNKRIETDRKVKLELSNLSRNMKPGRERLKAGEDSIWAIGQNGIWTKAEKEPIIGYPFTLEREDTLENNFASRLENTKVNYRIYEVFQKKLAEGTHSVIIGHFDNFGVCLTEKNTLKVTLTAKPTSEQFAY